MKRIIHIILVINCLLGSLCAMNDQLFDAVKNGNLDQVKLLISNGANINAETTYKWTPLHYAASHGYLDIAKLLISNGANVNAENTFKWTPLHLCCTLWIS